MVDFKTRYLIVRRSCSNCLHFLKALSLINPRLHPHRQIIVIDNYLAEEFNLKDYQIVEKMIKEGFEVYPFCYVDGIVVNPSHYKLVLYTLRGLLKDEFIY